jgi:hypothetical protein
VGGDGGGGFLRGVSRFRHSRGVVDLKGVVELPIVYGKSVILLLKSDIK